jgi:sugar lactone lactonase YvrE
MRLVFGTAFAAIVVASAVSAAGSPGLTGNDLITLVAGDQRHEHAGTGDGGPASKATFDLPWSVYVDKKGNIYIADIGLHTVRRITACGSVSTVAGVPALTGAGGFSGDGGAATKARFNQPNGLAVDSKGNLYIADRSNMRVRKVTPEGTISTFAGTGFQGPIAEGQPATSSALSIPVDVAVDSRDNVYIALYGIGTDVAKVTPDGIIHRFAGGGPDRDGEGIPATQAALGRPIGLGIDANDNVYVSAIWDWNDPGSLNTLVREVDRSGTITTVAGSRTKIPATEPLTGPATRLHLNYSQNVAIDRSGNVYFAEHSGGVVRKVHAGTLSVVAGGSDGRQEESEHDGGPAAKALFRAVNSVAFDPQGNLVVADTAHSTVRKIWTTTPTALPRLTVSGEAVQQPLAQHGVRVTVSCNRPCVLAAVGSIRVGGTVIDLEKASGSQNGSQCLAALDLRLSPAAQAKLKQLLTTGRRGSALVTVRAAVPGNAPGASGHYTMTVLP